MMSRKIKSLSALFASTVLAIATSSLMAQISRPKNIVDNEPRPSAQENDCRGNLIANGNFMNGLVAGPMGGGGSVSNWIAAYGTPDVSLAGFDPGSVGMWGNLNPTIGEGLQQNLGTNALVSGGTYLVSLRVKRGNDPNKQPYARFRVRASAAAMTSMSGGITMGLTGNITSTTWAPVSFTWTAPPGGPFPFVTINVENNLSANDGAQTSYGAVDDVCIRCLPLKLDPDFTLNATLAGSSPNYSLNATSAALPAGAGFWWQVEEIDTSGNVVSGTTMTNPSAWWANPTFTNFSGYCCNNASSPAGVFQQGHKYRITRGVWGPCNPWKAVSKTVFMCSNCKTREIQIENVSTIQAKPNVNNQ